VTIGLLLSLVVPVAARLIGSPLTDFFSGALLRVVMGLAALVAAIICGYFGWKVGRRLYREYELSPRQRRRLEELERRYAQRQRRRL
jgi:membrane protein DedA with SNARE-associated domain